MAKKMSKRDFLRYGLFAMGASVFGIKSLRTMANNFGSGLGEMNSSPAEKLWKWSKESPYSVVTPKGIKCQICPNNCIIREGEDSICRTHVVSNNKLYTIAYGNPCAVHIDPIEKKPLLHYLPTSRCYSIATAGCTLGCLNCQNWDISQESPRKSRNMDLMPARVVEEAASNGCRSIAYTYSEPIAFYEYTHDTAKLARARGIKNILVSNGYINEKPLRDLCKVLDAANIDLKSFSEEIYSKLNGGALQPVLNTLKIMKEEGVWLEITALIVPRWTDKIEMIREMSEWLVKNGFQDTPLHFSRFFPLYKLTNLPYTPLSILQQAHDAAVKAGMHYVYVGNVPEIEGENTLCPKCKKIVVERKGFTVIQNNIRNSCCKYCGTRIPGVWS
ncbi:MAG: AmmeMemoRadiSam system radical SAM enzyme [Bacteroidota bacterium]|nr:AmmeMemoRadiSam system radical SAM enzyme [Bacteroidota bacterium]